MPVYRKKPVEIEARQFLDSTIAFDLAQWCGGWAGKRANGTFIIAIPTLEGEMNAECGDYIIKGVKGEFYPCKPDIFAATYEQVPG